MNLLVRNLNFILNKDGGIFDFKKLSIFTFFNQMLIKQERKNSSFKKFR